MSDDDMEEDNEDENIDTVYIFEFFRKKNVKTRTTTMSIFNF